MLSATLESTFQRRKLGTAAQVADPRSGQLVA